MTDFAMETCPFTAFYEGNTIIFEGYSRSGPQREEGGGLRNKYGDEFW
jgi:hypothetical protein